MAWYFFVCFSVCVESYLLIQFITNCDVSSLSSTMLSKTLLIMSTLEQYLSKSIIALSLPFLLGTWATIIKYYKLVVLYHRNLFSHNSGGCKFRTRVPAWSTSAEGLLSVLQMTALLHHGIRVFTWRREREKICTLVSLPL